MEIKKDKEINKGIPGTLLLQLSKVIESRIGLHFPKKRWRDLERRIRACAQRSGFKDIETFAQYLVSKPLEREQIKLLASYLTVDETYFFRDKKLFRVLEEHILPELINSSQKKEKHIRIWSAACASGEEPYSIAILLSKMIADLKDLNITILATDVNPVSLKKASEGVYNKWSFRDVPQWMMNKYFKKKIDGNLEILPHIKKMVTFSHLNLAEDIYPSLLNNTNAMDIIFCCNALMYFTKEKTKKVIENLYNTLVDGGILFVGPSEFFYDSCSYFSIAKISDVSFYKKERKKTYKTGDFLVNTPSFNKKTPAGFNLKLRSEALLTNLTSKSDLPKKIPAQTINTSSDKKQKQEPERTPYREALDLYKKGLYAEAAEKIPGTVLHNRDDPKISILLAKAYANMGKLTEALDWCNNAISLDKLNPVYNYLCANILQEQGKIKEAIKLLKKALYLDPDFVIIHFLLGNLLLIEENLEESNRYFKNALELLSKYDPEETLPESDGINAKRLSEIITSITSKEVFV